MNPSRLLPRHRSGYFASAAASPDAQPCGLVELAASDLDERRSSVFEGRAVRFRGRLDEGHLLFGIRAGEEVASYLWVTGPGREAPLGLGVSFLVPEDMVYVWDCRTEEERRGRGFYRHGLEGLRRRFAGSCRDCLIAVEWGNLPAIRAMQRAGFVTLRCRYRLARLGPFGLYAKDGAPRLFHRRLRDDELLPGRRAA